MKSVLLGGLKVFLVNDGGKPLSAPGGRAKFYVAGTSTPATVYSDIDLTEADALGPVVYTDELGYLPAIWLKTDRLYKVRVEQKLPGSHDTWALLWEVDNVGYIDPHESEEPGEETVAVNSVAALKAVDHSAHTEVMVNGYYTAGDWGEPSMFIWDPSSTLSPDGGSVILPNGQEQSEAGRWLQVFRGDILDVRKFGAIPDLTLYADVTSEVVNAVNYSQRNSTRSRPITVGFVAPGKYYFSGNFDFSQYTFTDLSDNSVHPIKWFIGNDVVFVGHDSIFTLSSETICTATEALISGSAQLLVQGGGGIKVDPAWWGNSACVLEDCYVECHSRTFNDKSFTRCVVVSDGMLGASAGNFIELHDMEFSEFWFVDTFQWNQLTSSGLHYGVHDCRSAQSYVAVKTSQGDPNYGDLDGGVLSDAEILGNCLLENCSGSVEVTEATKTYNFRDVDLDVIGLDSVVGTTVQAHNSVLRLGTSGLSSGAVTALNMTGGQIVGVNFGVGSMVLDGVAVNAIISSVNTGTDKVTRCTIMKPMYVAQAELVGCDIRSRVTQKDISGQIVVKCIGNHFSGYGEHLIYSETANAIVTGSWSGNSTNKTNKHWILIDRTNIDLDDSHHSYSYVGNEQPFLDKYCGDNHAMILRPYIGTTFIGTGVFADETNAFIFYNTATKALSIVPRGMTGWKMFSVGIANVRRSGRIESAIKHYSNAPILPVWGVAAHKTGGVYDFSTIMGVRVNNVLNEDGAGYDWSFEQPDAYHDGVLDFGPVVAFFTTAPSDISDTFKVYPSVPTTTLEMYVHIERDFYSKNGD